jgi:hypothetical protein
MPAAANAAASQPRSAMKYAVMAVPMAARIAIPQSPADRSR